MQILLVDDHTLFRETLTLLLKSFRSSCEVISVSSAEEALSAVSHYADLDLILLDLALPGIDGISVLPILRERVPTVPVVVLSGNQDAQIIREVLSAGAVGFIPKTTTSKELQDALKLVLDGEIYLPPWPLGLVNLETATAPITSIQSNEILTQRQQEVLELLSLGLPNKSIANRLELTEGTVKLHVTAILRKLGARNRTEAVRQATHRGMLESVRPAL